MVRLHSSQHLDSASPRHLQQFGRRFSKRLPISVSIVAGLAVFLADAFVAPTYGLSALYIVLLIASIPYRSRRRLFWTTVMFMALSMLGFGLGKSNALIADGSMRLVINLGALVLTAWLIMRLKPNAEGGVTSNSQKSELYQSQQNLERTAGLFVERDATAPTVDQIVEHLTAILLGSMACKRWLDRANPNVEEARAAINGSIESARRASNLVQRSRIPRISTAIGA